MQLSLNKEQEMGRAIEGNEVIGGLITLIVISDHNEILEQVPGLNGREFMHSVHWKHRTLHLPCGASFNIRPISQYRWQFPSEKLALSCHLPSRINLRISTWINFACNGNNMASICFSFLHRQSICWKRMYTLMWWVLLKPPSKMAAKMAASGNDWHCQDAAFVCVGTIWLLTSKTSLQIARFFSQGLNNCIPI